MFTVFIYIFSSECQKNQSFPAQHASPSLAEKDEDLKQNVIVYNAKYFMNSKQNLPHGWRR